jgi:protein-tyrosine phosphatase
MAKVKVLFVCMGNICRSPTAHGVFRELVRQQGLQSAIEVDSAGTHAYHVGNPPDRRAQATATGRGIDLSDLRARQVKAADLEAFDYVLAMDSDNLEILRELPGGQDADRVRLFMSFAPDHPQREVPDPYYGGARGFDEVFDMVAQASAGLLADIRQRHAV